MARWKEDTVTITSYANPLEKAHRNRYGEMVRMVTLSCGHKKYSPLEPGEETTCSFGIAVPGSVHWRFGDMTQAEASHALMLEEKPQELTE